YQFLVPCSVISFLFTGANSLLVILFKREPLSKQATALILAVIWLGISLSTCIASFFSSYFQLGSSGTYCTVCYGCNTWLSSAVAVADLLGSFLNPFMLLGTFILVLREINKIGKTTMSGQGQLSITKIQLKLAQRGIVMVCLHMMSYFSTSTKVAYELATGELCPAWLDILAHLLHLLSLLTNPLVFFVLDGHAAKVFPKLKIFNQATVTGHLEKRVSWHASRQSWATKQMQSDIIDAPTKTGASIAQSSRNRPGTEGQYIGTTTMDGVESQAAATQ
ncbi:hypothetical protein HDU91_002869, partial [Kappamyces sp. JEL0680]